MGRGSGGGENSGLQQQLSPQAAAALAPAQGFHLADVAMHVASLEQTMRLWVQPLLLLRLCMCLNQKFVMKTLENGCVLGVKN